MCAIKVFSYGICILWVCLAPQFQADLERFNQPGVEAIQLQIVTCQDIPFSQKLKYVTDVTGAPIKWAFVIAIKKPITEWGLTEADGYYEIPDLEPGMYWGLAIKKGYKTGIKKANVVAGMVTTVDFMLLPKSGEDDEDKFPLEKEP